MSNRARKLDKPEKKARKAKEKAPRITVFPLLLALATLLGGFAALVTFLPRISVSPSDPVDPANPFSSSFTITNANIVPLREVTALLGIGQIATEPAQNRPNFVPTFTSRLTMPNWKDHVLSMDEKFTITLADAFGLPPGVRLSGGDIAIVITYKPWFLPFRREKVFRFITHRQSNGILYWYSQPLD
jgi:hypothetical protein